MLLRATNRELKVNRSSPHMHVVGVLVGRGFKRGLETKRLDMVTGFLNEKQDRLFDTSNRLKQTEKEVSEAERQPIRHENGTCRNRERFDTDKNGKQGAKQELMAEQEEIKQGNLSLKTDTLTLHARKENLLYDVSVFNGELEKRLDFINMLNKLKAILHKLLFMIPVVREFVRLVEEKRDIRGASPYGYTPLGRLLKEYRTPLPQYERLVIFPEIALRQTTRRKVVPLYEDFNRRGRDYRLVGFWNMQTEQGIKVFEIRDEIIPENRICTLEQTEVYMKAVESFMEDMTDKKEKKLSMPSHDKGRYHGR